MAPVPAAIFDIDGTLVDVSAIRHHVLRRPKRFDLFHGEAINCPPNQRAVELVDECLAKGLAILIVTARSEQWRFHTLLWLEEQGIEHDALLMRPHGDQRKDVLVKTDTLTDIRRHYDVRLAVDDNPSIIALWKANGIPVETIPGWQVEAN